MSTSLARRQWRHATDVAPSSDDLRVMTYNVLADVYVDHSYDFLPKEQLSVSYRHQKITQEVAEVAPDVVCLQEVSLSHFSRLSADLEQRGYHGRHMTYKFKGSTDGLALFYQPGCLLAVSLTECPSQHLIREFLQTSKICENVKGKIEDLAKRCQGMLMVRFKHLSSGKHVTIGNMHTKWSEFKLPALQCLDTWLCIRRLRMEADGGPFIYMGDFNSTPDFATYRLLREGQVVNAAWSVVPAFYLREKGGELACSALLHSHDVLDTVPGTAHITSDDVDVDGTISTLYADVMTHTPLHSAYVDVLGDEPPMTNVEASSWSGYVHELCLDYVWYSPRHLAVTSVLQTPSSDVIRREHALPSTTCPSDHVSLAATFRLLSSP